MKGITKQLSTIAGRQKEFSLDICRIENKFMENLNNSKVNMIKKYYLGDMEEKYLKIVEEVYEKKNREYLLGQQAEQFVERLKVLNGQINKEGDILLEAYS